jgi:hypothetical protein
LVDSFKLFFMFFCLFWTPDDFAFFTLA